MSHMKSFKQFHQRWLLQRRQWGALTKDQISASSAETKEQDLFQQISSFGVEWVRGGRHGGMVAHQNCFLEHSAFHWHPGAMAMIFSTQGGVPSLEFLFTPEIAQRFGISSSQLCKALLPDEQER